MDLCAKRFNMSAQLHEEGHVQGVQGLGPIERQRANAVLILAKNEFVHDFIFLVCPIEVQSLETL